MDKEKDRKFTAVWVSHSSIGDFLKCRRLYYLNNIYKNPISNRKISIINPPLILGQIVHSTLEEISKLPVAERFDKSLVDIFNSKWSNFPGISEIFKNGNEDEYRERGLNMIKRVSDNPGPLKNKAIKIPQDLPYFWLSEEDNIILCGKIDWLEYIEESDDVHLIDFKTGRHEEDPDSLQLPIYQLLVNNCQNRELKKASYWYLDRDLNPKKVDLPDLKESYKKILDIALKIKKAREEKKFLCKEDGCFHCLPYEKVVMGEGKLIGVNEYKQEMYVVNN